MCLLNIFATALPKRGYVKNYISILAMVNYRNWLDAPLPSNFTYFRKVVSLFLKSVPTK